MIVLQRGLIAAQGDVIVLQRGLIKN